MADNGNNQGNQGGNKQQQKQQPKPVCAFCDDPIENGASHCRNCGKPLKVTCQSCDRQVKNSPKPNCPLCGGPLVKKAEAKKVNGDYYISVAPAGQDGQYSLVITTIDDKKNAVSVPVQIFLDGVLHPQQRTDASGSLTITHNFTTKKCDVVAVIIGHPANVAKEKLTGPAFNCPPGTGFFERIRLRKQWNTGK